MAFSFPSGLNPDLFPLAWLVGEWEGEGQISYHEQVPTARAWNHIKFSHDGGTYLKYESTIRILGEGEAPIPGPVLDVVGIGSPEAQALLNRSGEASVADAAPDRAAQPFEVPSAASGTPIEGVNPADQRGSDDPDDAEAEALLKERAQNNDGAGSGNAGSSSDAGVAPAPVADVDPSQAEVWSSETGYWRVNPLPHGTGAANAFYLDVFIVDAGGRMTYFNGEAQPARIKLASAKTVRAALAAEVDGSQRMYGYVNDQLAWAEDLVAFGHELGSYASFLLTRTKDGDGNPVTPES